MHPSQPNPLLGGLATVAGALWNAGTDLWHRLNPNLADPATLVILVLIAVVGYYVLHKLVELLVKLVRYLVLPAVVLAVLAVYFLHVPFFTALPVCALGCSLVLLVKG